jgi:hypothetical protein
MAKRRKVRKVGPRRNLQNRYGAYLQTQSSCIRQHDVKYGTGKKRDTPRKKRIADRAYGSYIRSMGVL